MPLMTSIVVKCYDTRVNSGTNHPRADIIRLCALLNTFLGILERRRSAVIFSEGGARCSCVFTDTITNLWECSRSTDRTDEGSWCSLFCQITPSFVAVYLSSGDIAKALITCPTEHQRELAEAINRVVSA